MNPWITDFLLLVISSQKARVGACEARQWTCPRFTSVLLCQLARTPKTIHSRIHHTVCGCDKWGNFGKHSNNVVGYRRRRSHARVGKIRQRSFLPRNPSRLGQRRRLFAQTSTRNPRCFICCCPTSSTAHQLPLPLAHEVAPPVFHGHRQATLDQVLRLDSAVRRRRRSGRGAPLCSRRVPSWRGQWHWQSADNLAVKEQVTFCHRGRRWGRGTRLWTTGLWKWDKRESIKIW